MHGDDFTTVGPKDELDWLETKLEGKNELRKGERVVPGKMMPKRSSCSTAPSDGRKPALSTRRTADPRQAERLLKGLGLHGESTANPGLRAFVEPHVDDKALPESELTGFRWQAVRANSLAADRIDVHFAAKEVCSHTSAPTGRLPWRPW